MTIIRNETEIRDTLTLHGVTPAGVETLVAALVAKISREKLRSDVRLIRCMPVDFENHYGPQHGRLIDGWRVTDMYTADGDQACLGLVDRSLAPVAWRAL